MILFANNYSYECEALCRMFLRGGELKISEDGILPEAEDYAFAEVSGDTVTAEVRIGGKTIRKEEICVSEQNLCLERLLYSAFSEHTGISPKWGTLTGIRPVKLALAMSESGLSDDEIRGKLKKERFVSDEKISLLLRTAELERPIRALSRPDSVSIYISIPFCPSRCSYCSFTSHSIEKAAKLIPQYVELLCRELRDTAVLISELGLRLESVYMGGGTPTVLNENQLEEVLSTACSSFDMSTVREITVEAGRPDTITPEKLEVMRKYGVGRISVNPQTMDDEVLRNVGRKHTAQDIIDCYRLARTFGFESINMDLISGLPGDNSEKFRKTVDSVLNLEPDNITLHTLTVKHGANLAPDAQTLLAETVDEMNEHAFGKFAEAGYSPYYLYRQKGTVDNLENTGFCKPGKEGIYNIFIMDETHTILSTGAGGVTKMKSPYDTRIERIFNFKYPYEYIDRFELMNERKEQVKDFYARYPVNP